MIKITEPGIYVIPADEYHADPTPEPSLSSSIAKVLIAQTPRHAWLQHPRLNPNFERIDNKKFDLGTAAHAMLLEGEDAFVEIDAADWRTKAAKEARDAAYAVGKTPLLPHQIETVRAMVVAARAQLERHEDARGLFDGGKPEQTIIWREGDVWCRARPDWIAADGSLWDYKTTADANPDAWSRQCFNLGGDIQASFYRRGMAAITGGAQPDFRFIVQETAPPYALSVVALSPSAVQCGDIKVKRALSIWRWCMENDTWPGYPRETCWIEPPAWELLKLESANLREAVAKEQGDDLRAMMIDWQEPLED